MRKVRFILLILLLSTGAFVYAQNYDFGTEWEAEYSRTLVKGTQLNIGEEIRLKQYSTRFTKSETSVGITQALFRKKLKAHDWRLRIGATYAFIYRYNSKHYYEDQHRLNLNIMVNKKIGDWTLGYRMRYQTTFRDERIGNYKYNPHIYLRNRIGVSYSFPNTPWRISLTEECFQRLNHPSHRIVDEFRTVLSASLKIDRHNTISFHLKAATEVQVKNPDRFFALGFGYEFD